MRAALTLAHERGYTHVTRDDTAMLAGCAPGTVSRLYGTMCQFRRAMMSAAIARRDLVVLAQGLAAKDPKALAAPIELRRKAARALV